MDLESKHMNYNIRMCFFRQAKGRGRGKGKGKGKGKVSPKNSSELPKGFPRAPQGPAPKNSPSFPGAPQGQPQGPPRASQGLPKVSPKVSPKSPPRTLPSFPRASQGLPKVPYPPCACSCPCPPCVALGGMPSMKKDEKSSSSGRATLLP